MGVTENGNNSERHTSDNTGETIRGVVFKLAGHEHAVDVCYVREILQNPEVSPVIESADFVDGVINLRGRSVPVIDLRKRLGLPAVEKTYLTCVIIVLVGKIRTGFVVDSASELVKIPIKLIEPPSEILVGIHIRYVKGVVYLGKRFLILLDLENVLLMDEKEKLDSITVKKVEDLA